MFDARRGLAASLVMAAASLTAVLIPTSASAQSGSHAAADNRAASPAPAAASSPLPPASDFYPDGAARAGTSGRGVIDCAADAEGVLSDCKVVSETPEGSGFGAAAVKAAQAGLVHKRPEAGESRIVTFLAFTSETFAPPRRATGLRRLVGDAPPAAAHIKRGDVIVAFPFAFTRTAVLTHDLAEGKAKPMLNAGAPGFYAGVFGDGQVKIPIWCFLYATPPLDYLCLTSYGQASDGRIDAGAYAVKNAFSFSAIRLLPMRVFSSFTFEEKPVVIPGDLRMEYRFKRWTKTDARVEQWAGGKSAGEITLPRTADGGAVLRTLSGTYKLTPSPGAPEQADISAGPPP
jgi:hypothetical protein